MKLPLNADVIIPMCTVDRLHYFVNSTCIRTCRASTSARIHIMANNSPPSKWSDAIKAECGLLNVRYGYYSGPFAMNRFFNVGTQMTEGDYIAYCNSDLIFYPNWLENIVEAWEESPDYFCLASYCVGINGWEFHDPEPQRIIRPCANPVCGLVVLRRESGHVFDEAFVDWEQDADFHYHCVRNNLKCGYVMNARVDHLGNAFRDTVDGDKHYGITDRYGKATEYLRKKWKL